MVQSYTTSPFVLWGRESRESRESITGHVKATLNPVVPLGKHNAKRRWTDVVVHVAVAIRSTTRVQYNFSDVSISVRNDGGRLVIVNYQFAWSALRHSYNAKLPSVLLAVYASVLECFSFFNLSKRSFRMRLFIRMFYRLPRGWNVIRDL